MLKMKATGTCRQRASNWDSHPAHVVLSELV